MPSQQPSSPGDPPVQFLIVAAPRTGSTHLRLLLNSHDAMCCHGEVFREEVGSFVGLNARLPSPLRDRLAAARDGDPGAFLMNDVLYPGRMQAVGAKILYGTFVLDRWAGLLDRVCAERQVRIVHLVRRNGVKRFLSQYVVEQVTRVWLALTAEQRPSVGRVRVPVAELLADMAALEAQERRFRELFSGHHLTEVHYEDLISPTTSRGTLDDLQRFLGVEPSVLVSSAHKIVSNRLRDVVENVDEIESVLRGTPRAWMLDDDSGGPVALSRDSAAA